MAKTKKTKLLPKFKLLSPEQQRMLYPGRLHRALEASKARLRNQYATVLEDADKFEQKAKLVDLKIDEVENKVADNADVKHGGWWVWRHDKAKLHQVVAEMVAKSNPLRAEASALRAKATALRMPLIKELEELDAMHQKLLQDVA